MDNLQSINLSYILKYKKWSGVYFADTYGLKQASASKYIRGDVKFPVDVAIKLADDLNISLDYIYRWEITADVLEAGDPYYVRANKEPATAEPAGTYAAGNSHVDKVAQLKGLMEVFEHDPDMSERFNKELMEIGELFLEQMRVEKECIKEDIEKMKKKATA